MAAETSVMGEISVSLDKFGAFLNCFWADHNHYNKNDNNFLSFGNLMVFMSIRRYFHVVTSQMYNNVIK